MIPQVGDRVEFVPATECYTTFHAGTCGTVEDITALPPAVSPSGAPEVHVWVHWDNGSRLALMDGIDAYQIVERADPSTATDN